MAVAVGAVGLRPTRAYAVAIAPFENPTGHRLAAPLVDGLTRAVASRLSGVSPKLAVKTPARSNPGISTAQDAVTLGRSLGVDPCTRWADRPEQHGLDVRDRTGRGQRRRVAVDGRLFSDADVGLCGPGSSGDGSRTARASRAGRRRDQGTGTPRFEKRQGTAVRRSRRFSDVPGDTGVAAQGNRLRPAGHRARSHLRDSVTARSRLPAACSATSTPFHQPRRNSRPVRVAAARAGGGQWHLYESHDRAFWRRARCGTGAD